MPVNPSLHPCHVRTAMIAVGCFLLGRGELAFDDLQTMLGAAGPAAAAIWKLIEARSAAAEPHDHA